VVVEDLNIEGVAVLPAEADPPLIVDTDIVLFLTISRESLESVTRRHPQIRQGLGRVENQELLQCGAAYVWRKPLRASTIEDPLGVQISEAPDFENSFRRSWAS